MTRPRAILAAFCMAKLLSLASSVSPQCLSVAAAASDTSSSGVELQKNGSVVDAVCPGVTYGLVLTFPEPRAYEVVSSRGAFTGGASNCPNRLSGSAAGSSKPIKVPLKLYIGCAATGTLQLSVLSKAQTASAMAIKTVAKPIKALSACPASTCNPSSSPAPAASPAPSPAPAGSTTIKLTGNPAVDMMTMWGMFASGMNTSGFMNMPFLPGMDFNTVLTIISGLGNINTASLQATTTITTIQSLLSMVPAGSDSTGMVSGMQRFLGIMQQYVPSTATGASSTQQMSASAVKTLSSMATMLSGAATGNQMTSVLGMAGFMSSISDVMTLARTTALSTPGVVVPATGAGSSAATNTTTTTPAAGGATTTSGSGATTATTTTPTSTDGTTPTTSADPASGTTTADPASGTTTTSTGATEPAGSSSTTSSVAAGESNGASAGGVGDGSAPVPGN